MASLSRLFKVTIGRQTTAAQYGVFGVGCILAPSPAFFGLTYDTFQDAAVTDFTDLYRVYSGASAADNAASDGMTGDNLAYVQDYFSQTPSPDTLVVGDFSAAFTTQVIQLNGATVKDAPEGTIATIGFINGGKYYYATYTGDDWTGSTGADTLITVSATATDKFEVEGRIVYLEGATPDHSSTTGVAANVTSAILAIKKQYSAWFMAVTTSRDVAVMKAISDWTETQADKMAAFLDDYTADDWQTNGIAAYLFAQNMAGSLAVTTMDMSKPITSAMAGRCLVMAPGSETWAIKTLNSIAVDPFDETDYAKIRALNSNTFEDYGSGIRVTYPGTCGDGESIEVVRFAFWQADRIQKDQATLYVNQNKVGVDPEGIELTCLQIEKSLKAGQTAGGIMTNFNDSDGNQVKGFTVTRPSMDDISAVQRINGEIDIPFSFYLRYAIKHVNAIGTAKTYGI